MFIDQKLHQVIHYQFGDEEVGKIIEEQKKNTSKGPEMMSIYSKISKLITDKSGQNNFHKQSQDANSQEELSKKDADQLTQTDGQESNTKFKKSDESNAVKNILDDIKNKQNVADTLIALVKKALHDTGLYINCICARLNGFAIG